MKTLKLVAIAIALTFVGLTPSAQANDVTSCGVAGVVGQKGLLGFLTNLTSMGTFTMAVTTGTSGCGGVVMSELERLNYASASYDDLAEEASVGQGQHLKGMAALMGCDQAQQPAFELMAKTKFDALFTAENKPAEFLTRLRVEMDKDASLKSCSARHS